MPDGTGPRSVAGGIGERAGFRLAVFGALLVVVLFAGYGLGRLNSDGVSASAPTNAAPGQLKKAIAP